MALSYQTLGFSRGEIVLNNDGTFKTCFAFKKVGVWDSVKNDWASPPQDMFDGEKTLAQLKTFIANLT